MKIQELLRESFMNPLGHLLAAANILMIFSSALGIWRLNEKIIIDLNRPAILAGQLLGGEFTGGLFTLQLIYLQWILIAAFAKFTAAAIRPDDDYS